MERSQEWESVILVPPLQFKEGFFVVAHTASSTPRSNLFSSLSMSMSCLCPTPLMRRKKAVKLMLCMKFVAAQALFVKMHILVRHLNHYSIVLNNAVDLVTMKMVQPSSNTQLRVDVKLMSMMLPSLTERKTGLNVVRKKLSGSEHKFLPWTATAVQELRLDILGIAP